MVFFLSPICGLFWRSVSRSFETLVFILGGRYKKRLEGFYLKRLLEGLYAELRSRAAVLYQWDSLPRHVHRFQKLLRQLDLLATGDTHNAVVGCKIEDNSKEGLDVRHSKATVMDTDIRYNSSCGIYLEDSLETRPSNIEGCVIANNGADGILIHYKAVASINGCSIFSNGQSGYHYALRLLLYIPEGPIDAEYNFWGLYMDTPEKVGEQIWDRADERQNSNAFVDFEPFYTDDPNL